MERIQRSGRALDRGLIGHQFTTTAASEAVSEQPAIATRRIHLRGNRDSPLARLILGNKPLPAPFIRAAEDRGDEIIITVKVTRRNFRDFAYLNVDEMCPAPDAAG
jgi:hypothetical protein